jgi:micrococcal nuclease
MNYYSKIKKEKKIHIPAALLIKLGDKSLEFFKSNMKIGEICILIQEENNLYDKYE